MVRIRLLGEPELRLDGGELIHLRARCVSLLAFLVHNRDRTVSRALAASALWPDELENTTRANLRRNLHLIASALPTSDAPLYSDARGRLQWNEHGPSWVDLIEFERLASSYETASDAVALYRGDFLQGIDDEWVLGVRESIRGRFVDLLLLLGERSMALGHLDRAIEMADRLLLQDEWREDAIRLKMGSLYRAGDRVGALQVFERFADALKREMGVEPMLDTAALNTAIIANLSPSYLLLDHTDESAAADAPSTLPFIGRDAELATLRSAWHRAARGNGTTIFVQGEAGIGKSRLTRELSNIVSREGGCVLKGTTSHPQAEPYQPIVGALRRGTPFLARATIDDVWLATLGDVMPEVFGLRQHLAPPQAIDPSNAASRLFEAFVRAFTAIARIKPLLLVVEDLHWADDTTLTLLDALARRASALPLLIVCTFRTADVQPESFPSIRHALVSAHRASILPLGGLQPGDFASMSSAADFAAIPREVIEHAADHASGNPLFVTLLIQAYKETGAMATGSSASSIGEVIALRLRALNDRARSVAQTASAIGIAFDALLLARITGWSDAETYTAIDELVDAGIVRETSASFEYAFSHALIERALYDSIEGGARVQRHRRIAVTLDRANEPRHAAVVARHWAQAGDRESARRAYARAMHLDLSAFAWSAAREHAGAAIKLCESDQDRFDVLLAIVKSGKPMGDIEAWKADVAALAATSDRIGSVQARMDALTRRGELSRHIGDRLQQKSAADQIVELATQSQLNLYRAEGLAALAVYYFDTTQLNESIRAFEELFNLEESPEPATRPVVLGGYGSALFRMGRIDEAGAVSRNLRSQESGDEALRFAAHLDFMIAHTRRDLDVMARYARELLDIDRRRGDIASELGSLARLAQTLERSPDEARVAYARATELAETGVVPQLSAVIAVNWSQYEYELGCFDRAIELAQRASEVARTLDVVTILARALMNEAQALREVGDVGVALTLAEHARDLIVERTELDALASATTCIGVIELKQGDVSRAIATLEEAAVLRRSANQPASLAVDLASLARAYVKAHALEKARALADEIIEVIGDRIDDQYAPTELCSAIAMVSAACGDAAREVEWIARGRGIANRMLQHISDEATKRAYRSLPHNRHVLGAT